MEVWIGLIVAAIGALTAFFKYRGSSQADEIVKAEAKAAARTDHSLNAILGAQNKHVETITEIEHGVSDDRASELLSNGLQTPIVQLPTIAKNGKGPGKKDSTH